MVLNPGTTISPQCRPLHADPRWSAFLKKLGLHRSNKAETSFVTAFLSCSVRSEDRPLVDPIEDRVLTRMGFHCLAVGRNISMPDQVDDAVRNLVQRVDLDSTQFKTADFTQ